MRLRASRSARAFAAAKVSTAASRIGAMGPTIVYSPSAATHACATMRTVENTSYRNFKAATGAEQCLTLESSIRSTSIGGEDTCMATKPHASSISSNFAWRSSLAIRITRDPVHLQAYEISLESRGEGQASECIALSLCYVSHRRRRSRVPAVAVPCATSRPSARPRSTGGYSAMSCSTGSRTRLGSCRALLASRCAPSRRQLRRSMPSPAADDARP